VLRKKLSKFGMAAAGITAGGILAISPVFAQGTTPSNPSANSTLLADILAAVKAAGITLTAEQTKDLAEMVAEISAQATPEVDEDEDEDDDDVAVATTTKKETKQTVTITFTAPKSTEKSDEEKGDD